MARRVVLLSVPQLRHKDVTPGALASLEALAGRGALAEFLPAFPSLAAPSFATIVTGTGPYQHGMVGDSFFDRTPRKVISRPFADSVVLAPKLWDRLRRSRPEAKSLAWFTPNLHGAAVDRGAWVDPVEGLMTEPAGLAAQLTSRFGPYPWPRSIPSGEPLRLEATGWILKTAAATIAAELPDLSVVRVPFLGQIARRFGPDGREAGRAVWELEAVLAPFLRALPKDVLTLVVTESVSTPVTDPVYPNTVLRGLGLLSLTPAPRGGLDVDLEKSAAFALADHQICHIYLNDSAHAATVAATFSGAHSDGVATVACGAHRAALGLDHPRSGDVVLVAYPDRWFAPDWWNGRAERPGHLQAPSGLLNVGASLDPTHVHGSLGAPPPSDDYLGVIISSAADLLAGAHHVSARDLSRILSPALGIA